MKTKAVYRITLAFLLTLLALSVLTPQVLAQNNPPIADAGPDQTMNAGGITKLQGSAYDPDGNDIVAWLWTVESAPAGPPPFLSQVDRPDPTFSPEVAGEYVLSLIASDGPLWSIPDYVTIYALEILPPVAIATADVTSGPAPLTVHFDGSQSYARCGTHPCILEYVWNFDDGTLSTDVSPTHVFLLLGTHVVTLTVFDSLSQSDTDTLLITVLPPKVYVDPPEVQEIAIGGSFSVDIAASDIVDSVHSFEIKLSYGSYGTTILDCTEVVEGSFLPSGGTTTFDSTIDDASGQVTVSSTLSDPTASVSGSGILCSLTFTVIGQGSCILDIGYWSERPEQPYNCLFDISGNEIMHYVSDGFYNRPFTQNNPPVVDAGPDQTIYVGEYTGLPGSAYDPDGNFIVAWLWTVESAPAGSSPYISEPDTADPIFCADVAGEYVLWLKAADGMDWSDPDIVTITVLEILPPVAIATANVTSGLPPLTVQFNGSQSYPRYGTELIYRWDFGDGSETSPEVSPTHVYLFPGTYLARLHVLDSIGQSDDDTILITVYWRVHNINTTLNYWTIQEAIDAIETLDGHTILVYPGTYSENVDVYKQLNIVGAGAEVTIVEAFDPNDYVFYVTANNVNMSGFTVKDATGQGKAGVYLYYSDYSKIENINASNNYFGISLFHSSNNTVSSNNITNNNIGVVVSSSSNNNNVSGNNITNNIHGIELAWSSDNNTVSGNNITNSICGVYLASSSDNTVSGNNITNSDYGVYLSSSSNNTVSSNNITNSDYGVFLASSSNNTVSGNNITNSANYGVYLALSSDNTFYHNNFIDNTQQVYIHVPGYANFWDNGYPTGGNYWSNYAGGDLYSGLTPQNGIGSDGIGDVPHVIDGDNQDNYPFMGQNGWETHPFTIESNVTITDRRLTTSTLNFNVSGPTGLLGYINITMPMGLNTTDIIVLVDGTELPPPFPIITNNSTHYFIYFEFTLSTHTVVIQFVCMIESAIEELIETIETSDLPKGTKNSLTSKLDDAIHLFNKGNENGAIRKLIDFIDQVEALRGKDKLTDAQANYLISEAQRIIGLING